ncbi:MAG: preprotein translocase subunit SecE [Bacillota bacterium]
MAKDNPGIVTKITKFFKQVKNEMKKTNWPNKQELSSNTVVVLITVTVLIAFVGVIDVVLSGVLTPFFL